MALGGVTLDSGMEDETGTSGNGASIGVLVHQGGARYIVDRDLYDWVTMLEGAFSAIVFWTVARGGALQPLLLPKDKVSVEA